MPTRRGRGQGGTGYISRSSIREFATNARAFSGFIRNTKLDFLRYGTFIKGRMFGRWIDSVSGSARSNGYDAGDLIECPPYVIESLLRDELFIERDLIISSGGLNLVTCSSLKSAIDDFYNYAIYYNLDNDFLSYVADYSGVAKTLQLAANDGATLTSDRFYLTNIQGDNKINYQSFDLIGNTTDGLRKDWKFAKSVYEKTDAIDLLESLLFEMRCIMILSNDQYKLIALDAQTSVDTWTPPLKLKGHHLFSSDFTPISQLYNDYRINYNYHHGQGAYTKSLFVNKSGYSSALTSGSTYRDTCKTIYDTYKITNKFEYNCDWIYDDDTAELFFDKIFEFYSKQRMIVNWSTPVSGYIQYEVGDQVILNNTKIIPTGINNTSKFIIMENPTIIIPGAPMINFKLLEIS